VQKKNKISIEMQLDAIKKKIGELGLPQLHDTRTFEDRGISGAKFEERKGLQELLGILQEPASRHSTVMVYRFDRLSRDTRIMLSILEALEKNNIKLVSVMESLPANGNIAMQKMMIQVHAIVAQFSRDITIDNIRLGLTQKRSEGKPLSAHTPFGYQYSKDVLLPIVEELEIVRRIYDLYITGQFGYEKIVKCLTQDGYLFRKRPFLETDICRILSNKTYHGVFKGGDVGGEYQGKHKTVVTEDEYIAVQQIRQRKHFEQTSKRYNQLRKKIVCPRCSQKLTPKAIRSSGRIYHYYYCANPKCQELAVNADAIEKDVKKAVIQFLVQSSVLDQTVDEIKARQYETLTQSRRNKLRTDRKKERLLLQFEEGNISSEAFSRAFSELRRVDATDNRRPKITVSIKDVEALIQQRTQVKKQKLPEEFYFNLVDHVNVDERYRIKEIYLKNLNLNIIKQEEIKL
jgi:site-specific DNA recombinase